MTKTIPTETVVITKTKRNKRGHREERAYASPGSRESRSYLVTVQLDDMRYTAESSGNAFWDFNPTRLVVNDKIGVCIDKNKLVVKRPDGKNYNASIVRVVRTPSAERETSSAVSSSRGWDRYVERPRLGGPATRG